MASPTFESDTLVSSKKSKDRHLRKRDYDREVESEEDYDVREPEKSHEKKKSRSKVKDKSDRDRGRDGEGERSKSRGKDRDREKGRDRDGEKVRHRDKERHKEERSREKEKLREERDREKERLREEKERQREEKERQREEKERLREEKERLKEEKERLKAEKEQREREKEKARLREEKEQREKERLREEKEQREKERVREEKEQREKERLREERELRERLKQEKEQREKERLREERELRERLKQEKEQREKEKERLRAEKEQQERQEREERELREEKERERLEKERQEKERERLREEEEQREAEEREQELEKLRLDREREKKDKEKLKEQREKERMRQEREREKKEEKEKLREDRLKEKEKLREVRDRDKDKERELDATIAVRDKDRTSRDREKKDRDRHRNDRDKDRAKERDKDKHADREKEKVKDKEKKRRDREKDKDREKEKYRDRDKERDEDDDRERDRKRRKREEEADQKDKEKDRDKQKDREKADEDGVDKDRKRKRREDETEKTEGKLKKDPEEEDPDEEQKKLDEEMEKRRRRVQEWQELRRRKEEEERKKRGEMEDVVEPEASVKKTWTLEGEESDDEDLPKVEDLGTADVDSASKVSALENGDLVMLEAAESEAVPEAGTKPVPGDELGDESEIQATTTTASAEPKAELEPECAQPMTLEVDHQPISEEADPTVGTLVEEDDGIDPLDAFMNTMIMPEVEKLNSMNPVPAEVGKSEVRLKDRGGVDNGKQPRRSSRNATGRIIPGEESASEDERDEGDGTAGDEEDDDFLKRVKKTKADKLAPVDHSKIQYPAFRKNFYIEVKEISRMHVDEVAAYRKELELKIRGKDVPRPVKTWNQTGLSSKALEVIKKSGFEKPMPIQTQALPIIMSGRDCIGIAKTGSGKTLAFVLPMLRHIMDQPPLSQGDGPIGLIMAPTRELVQQIYNDIKKFTKVLGLSCVPVYGGSGVAQQISDLKRGTEIVVCTPGRMIDILCTSAGKITNLRRVTYFVMDEADRMFDMGFEPQITRIVQNTRPDRQTVLFSATFPRQVEVLARKVLTKPIEIQVGGRSVVNRDITQTVEVRPDNERFLRLLELLGEWYEKGKVLIFVHSQEKCDSLFRDLLKAGYPCLSLHGAKEQTDRESTIADFKRNVCNLMIATSIAARGLDVKELELVLNYDVPNHYEDYVHRVGRTGRAGRKGVAVTFISTDEDRYAPDLVKALELSEQPVPDDLKKLADDFMAKVSQGTEQAHGSGYGGSGFKFNEEEDEARKAAKKAQAKEYGFEEDEDKSDSDSDDGTIRKQGGDLSEAAAQAAQAAVFAAATKVSQPSATNPQFQAALLAAQAAASRSLQSSALTSSLGLIPGFPGLSGAGMMGGFVGMQGLAGMTAISGMTGLGIPGFGQTLSLAAAGSSTASAMGAAMGDGAARAAAYAAALNLQHNLAKIQADAIPEHYEAELEINDFPQHARWKVTHKDALGQISEWTGAAITTRGQYFPTGKNPSPGERKLFLFIEGPTEASVKKAKAEIKRILEESTSAAISLPGSTQPGKYSVL